MVVWKRFSYVVLALVWSCAGEDSVRRPAELCSRDTWPRMALGPSASEQIFRRNRTCGLQDELRIARPSDLPKKREPLVVLSPDEFKQKVLGSNGSQAETEDDKEAPLPESETESSAEPVDSQVNETNTSMSNSIEKDETRASKDNAKSSGPLKDEESKRDTDPVADRSPELPSESEKSGVKNIETEKRKRSVVQEELENESLSDTERAEQARLEREEQHELEEEARERKELDDALKQTFNEEADRSVVHDEEEEEKFNFASLDAGAIIMGHNKAMKHSSSLLVTDRDKYALSPCEEEPLWVTIGLSEEIEPDIIELSNFERYSSTVKTFQVLGGNSKYPVSEWVVLGEFEAKPELGVQQFLIQEKAWVRYIKFRFLSHFGDEFYCTLTEIRVYGSTDKYSAIHLDLDRKNNEVERLKETIDKAVVHPTQQQTGEPVAEKVAETGDSEPPATPAPTTSTATDQAEQSQDTASLAIEASMETTVGQVDQVGIEPSSTASDSDTTAIHPSSFSPSSSPTAESRKEPTETLQQDAETQGTADNDKGSMPEITFQEIEPDENHDYHHHEQQQREAASHDKIEETQEQPERSEGKGDVDVIAAKSLPKDTKQQPQIEEKHAASPPAAGPLPKKEEQRPDEGQEQAKVQASVEPNTAASAGSSLDSAEKEIITTAPSEDTHLKLLPEQNVHHEPISGDWQALPPLAANLLTHILTNVRVPQASAECLAGETLVAKNVAKGLCITTKPMNALTPETEYVSHVLVSTNGGEACPEGTLAGNLKLEKDHVLTLCIVTKTGYRTGEPGFGALTFVHSDSGQAPSASCISIANVSNEFLCTENVTVVAKPTKTVPAETASGSESLSEKPASASGTPPQGTSNQAQQSATSSSTARQRATKNSLESIFKSLSDKIMDLEIDQSLFKKYLEQTNTNYANAIRDLQNDQETTETAISQLETTLRAVGEKLTEIYDQTINEPVALQKDVQKLEKELELLRTRYIALENRVADIALGCFGVLTLALVVFLGVCASYFCGDAYHPVEYRFL